MFVTDSCIVCRLTVARHQYRRNGTAQTSHKPASRHSCRSISGFADSQESSSPLGHVHTARLSTAPPSTCTGTSFGSSSPPLNIKEKTSTIATSTKPSIYVARTVHEALRGIGAATGRIAGLTQAQQAGGHSGGDGTAHLLHGVENGAAISSHAARQRFERSGLRRLLDERNAHHHDDVRGQEQHNTRVNTDGKEQRTTATPDSPRLGR